MARKSQRRRKIWRWLFSKKRSFGSEKNGKILKIECTKRGGVWKNQAFFHIFFRCRQSPIRTKRFENAIFRSISRRRHDVFLSNYFLRKIVSTKFEFSYFLQQLGCPNVLTDLPQSGCSKTVKSHQNPFCRIENKPELGWVNAPQIIKKNKYKRQKSCVIT